MSSRIADPDAIQEAGLDPARMPCHVAVIMDGNGRWARERGWLRMRGHRQGAETVRMVITESARLGIEHLTLYAFSSENWSRPTVEIDYLMGLLDQFLRDELPTLREHGVRLRAIGRLGRLPGAVRETLERTIEATAGYRRMTVYLALSYGGRDELVDACRSIAMRVQRGELSPEAIDHDELARHLYAPGVPDVDLVLRSAGELRLSNFLPWQTVYAEYVVLPVYWPEVNVAAYRGALREYQGRQRRFGAVSSAGAAGS